MAWNKGQGSDPGEQPFLHGVPAPQPQSGKQSQSGMEPAPQSTKPQSQGEHFLRLAG